MYRTVEGFGRRIEGEELQRMLVEAAEELGLTARVVDKYQPTYKFESGGVRAREVYERTNIRLRGRFFPVAEITGIKRGESSGWFAIATRFCCVPPYFGFGSKKLIDRYLNAFYKRFNASIPDEQLQELLGSGESNRKY